MTEREKVIRGLECRLDINGSKYKHCLTCDYRHDIDHCQWACQTDGILEDALALLKAQEARLVTYEDFHSGREDGGEAIPCWKEARSKTRRSGWAVVVYGKTLADRETGVARYWTTRPTEEQMREEAWPGTR